MPRSSTPTSALYVRLPTAEADKLDRAARALGVPKRALVTGLVAALADPGGEPAPAAGERAAHRVAVRPGVDTMPVGSYSFHPREELPEVLTAEQAGVLLQVAEAVVVQLAETGRLPGRRLGETWRFSRAGLVAWLSQGTEHEGHPI